MSFACFLHFCCKLCCIFCAHRFLFFAHRFFMLFLHIYCIFTSYSLHLFAYFLHVFLHILHKESYSQHSDVAACCCLLCTSRVWSFMCTRTMRVGFRCVTMPQEFKRAAYTMVIWKVGPLRYLSLHWDFLVCTKTSYIKHHKQDILDIQYLMSGQDIVFLAHWH